MSKRVFSPAAVNGIAAAVFLLLLPLMGGAAVSLFGVALRIVQREDFNWTDHAYCVGLDGSTGLLMLAILIGVPLWLRWVLSSLV